MLNIIAMPDLYKLCGAVSGNSVPSQREALDTMRV